MDSVERVLLSITKVSTLQKIRNSNLRFHSKFICSGFRKSPGPVCGSSDTHTLIVRCNQMHPETEINQETIKSKWRTEQIAAKLHSKWKNTRVLVWRWMQPERWLTIKPLVWQETALYELDRGIKFKKTNSLNSQRQPTCRTEFLLLERVQLNILSEFRWGMSAVTLSTKQELKQNF